MFIFPTSQVSYLEGSSQFLYFRAVSVIAEIDMDLFFVRILQEGTGVDCLIEKISRLIVGGDQHIYGRVELLRDIYGYDCLCRGSHLTAV